MTHPLISASELRNLLSDNAASRPVILDVRYTLATGPQRAEYEAGHIPGAVFCNVDEHLATAPGEGGRHPLPSLTEMQQICGKLGIAPDTHVVVYDDAGSLPASRAWWCLMWAGVAKVQLLDGGLRAWRELDAEMEQGWNEPTWPDLTAAEVDWPERGQMPMVDVDAVAAGVGQLIDVRTPERFRGESEPIDPVAGHIPGAVNCPMGGLMAADGKFLDAAELEAALSPVLAKRMTAYCGSGITAAQFVLAAAVAGHDVSLYPGSWSHWITDPTRPIATDVSR